MLHHGMGQTAAALEDFQQAIEIWQQLVESHPAEVVFQVNLAGSQHNVGHLFGQSGQTQEAKAAFQKTLKLRQQLVRIHPEINGYRAGLAGCYSDLGVLLFRTGQAREAQSAYQQALEIQEHLAGDHPANAMYQASLGGTLNNLAMHDLNDQRFEDACARLIRAIECQHNALAVNPDDYVPRQRLNLHLRLFFVAVNELGKAENWGQAALFGRQLIDQDVADPMIWLRVAPLIAHGGNPDAYSEFCERIMRRFADTEDPTIADKVCKACLLRSHSIEIEELPREVLTNALDDETAPEWFPPWGWGTRALLAYRSGDAESAIEFVQESEKHEPDKLAHAINLAVVALGQNQLGDQDAAEDARNELTEIIEQSISRPDNFHDVLIARILLDEAEGKMDANSGQ